MHTLLWQFNTPYLVHTNYLFGTIHANNNAAYHNIHLAEKYIDKCTIYCGEVSIEEIKNYQMVEANFLDSGLTITDLVGVKKYNKWRGIIEKAFQIDIENYLRCKPIIIANAITNKIINTSNKVSVDEHLWNTAIDLRKATTGLETVVSQVEEMNQIPILDQIKSLSEIVKNVSKHRRLLLKMSVLYKDMNIAKIYTYSKKSLGSLRQSLLYKRNENMCDRIMHLTAGGSSVFVSCGAGHMSGNKGLLKLLKSRGCVVKPIFV